MKENRKRISRCFLPILGFLLLMSISTWLIVYRINLKSSLQSARYDTLDNIMGQQRFTFYTKLEDQKNAMMICADFFGYADDITYSEMMEKLNLSAEQSTFKNLTYANTNGDAIENTGNRLNLSDREYFRRSLRGETVVDGPMKSKIDGEDIVIFSMPVTRDNRIVAVLVGVYDAEALSELLMPSFGGNSYTYVTTNSGDVIFKTASGSVLDLYSNLFDTMDTCYFYGKETSQNIRDDVARGAAGHTQYSMRDVRRLMCYEPVGINDWYIFSAAPEEFINPQSLEIMYRATTFMLFIALLAVTVFIYITITQKKHVSELRRIAFVDSLTGDFNKKKFKLTASELLSKSERDYAFVILDIDKFKVLNDALGYPCGDELLMDIAAVLKERMQEGEIFGRCDSDEFYILLFYVDDAALRSRINAIMAQIEMKFNSRRTYSYRLILCAGVYVISKPNEAINVISDRARHAHRLIKGKDESGIAFYNDEIRNNILQEKVIENRMHGALENKEFVIFLQPKYYLNSSKIYGAEALCRWQNSDGTMMYPNDFIPIFEKNGFVTKLDMYMLSMACKTIKGWIDVGITPIPISINFSRLHLKNQFFVDDIAAIVQEYNVPTHLIEIELTESTMLDNEDVLINMLTHLHEHGFTLSMDDFGSGYSSLGLLKNLPVDVIKLDRSFVIDYCELKRAVTVIAGIITMAQNLGIKTVAEGVETKEQVAFLRDLGCDIVQGYYFAKPMAAEGLTQILKAETEI